MARFSPPILLPANSAFFLASTTGRIANLTECCAMQDGAWLAGREERIEPATIHRRAWLERPEL